MRKLPPFFILTLLLFRIVSVCAEEGVVKRSIVVVFDLSYSMAAIDADTGLTRHELGIRALEKVLEDPVAEEEWSLIVAEDTKAITTVADFTTEPYSFIPLLEKWEPWGRTSVDAMILAGVARFSGAAAGTDRYLLLITDGIHTGGRLYDLRDFDIDGDPPVVPVVMGYRISEYANLERRVTDWITGSGGIFLLHDQAGKLRGIFTDGEPGSRAAPNPPAEKMPDGEYRETQATVLHPGIEMVSFPVWWIFLIPAAGFAGAAAQLLFKWHAKKKLLSLSIGNARKVMTLACSVYDGEAERYTFDTFPVRVSGSGKADLLLEKPRISSGARSFSIKEDRQKEAFEFAANAPLVIDGVGRTKHLLSAGDRIHFGRYRIVFEGVRYIEPPRPEAPRPGFLLLVPVILFSIALSVLFRDPVTITRKKNIDAVPATTKDPALAHERSNGRGPLGNPAPVSSPVPADTVESLASPGYPGTAAAAIFKSLPEDPRINTFPTVMWEPGVRPDFFKVDVLLFHAHPDDETLDFGVLLRRLADSGRRTAVVLCTDGNSGLDQYPWRATGEDYPEYDLSGKELAEIRVQEAHSAMSVLGVNHYVRLGLMNHPYGGLRDELSTDAVITAWGGEDQLVESFSTLILGYRPDIIVSPEPPAAALEHFEHEAVGFLAEAAMQKLERDGNFVPPGRLVSVDPLQKALYPDAIGIRSDGVDSGCGLSYRAIQAAALDEHRTQRDATVIGIENLSGFDREYYRVLSWDMLYSLEEYLSGR